MLKLVRVLACAVAGCEIRIGDDIMANVFVSLIATAHSELQCIGGSRILPDKVLRFLFDACFLQFPANCAHLPSQLERRTQKFNKNPRTKK